MGNDAIMEPLVSWAMATSTDPELANQVDARLLRTPGGSPPTEDFEENFVGIVHYHRAPAQHPYGKRFLGVLKSGTSERGLANLWIWWNDSDCRVKLDATNLATSGHPVGVDHRTLDVLPDGDKAQINILEEDDREGEWILRLRRTTRWAAERPEEPSTVD